VGVQRKSDTWLLARNITCDTGSGTVTHYAFMVPLWKGQTCADDRRVQMTDAVIS
jgi:hypothetical protein